MYRNDCLVSDSEIFILFAENSQILLKISVIPILLTFIYLAALNLLKFGLSEKHTKFKKNLLHGFGKSADLLSKRQNHDEDFFKLCVLLKKSDL